MNNPAYIQDIGLDEIKSLELIIFDFDGVFTDNAVYVDQHGVESVRCSRGDGLGLARVSGLDIEVCIVSTEINPVVTARAEKLKMKCWQAVSDKSVAVREVCSEFGVDPKKSMFVGNDINDIPAFKAVGIPVGVTDCFDEILPHISYITHRKGGYGAVREICDIVYQRNFPQLTGDAL